MSQRTIKFPIIAKSYEEAKSITNSLDTLLKESFNCVYADDYEDERGNKKIFYFVAPTKNPPSCDLDSESNQEILKAAGWKPESERYPYPQISMSGLLNYNGDISHTFDCDMISCFPIYFGDYNSNHEVTDKLISVSVVEKKQCDPESSCSHFLFKNTKEAEEFIASINAWFKAKYQKMQKAKEF